MNEMEIELQVYWGAKVQTMHGKSKLIPEETIKKYGDIYICDIAIDKKLVGTVVWDGKKLSIKTKKKE